ncbi:sulfur carrier protein ThiS adenylyltransferase ThiF [Clostridium sp. CTA-19]
MLIKVNGRSVEISENVSINNIKEKMYPNSDMVIINGFPIKEDKILKDKDELTFIKKGEKPKKEELETLMVSRHTKGVFEKLKKSVVGVAGLGGLGSNIAIFLARIGVGRLVLVDFDVVEPSNLNRQQYYIRNIGMKKTDAIKEIIKEINSYILVEVVDRYLDKDNAIYTFKDCDVVIEAFDNAKCKAELVNAILLNTNKYIISGNGMAGSFSSNSIITKKINSRFYVCGDGENEAKEGSGLMAPRVSIAAGHMANMSVRILLGDSEV